MTGKSSDFFVLYLLIWKIAMAVIPASVVIVMRLAGWLVNWMSMSSRTPLGMTDKETDPQGQPGSTGQDTQPVRGGDGRREYS